MKNLIKSIDAAKSFLAPMLLLMLVILTTSCKKKPDASGAPSIEKGYTTGRVTNTQGQPMEGVNIVVENQLVGNHTYLTSVTDKNGYYKIKLTAVGTFHTSADTKVNFNGKQYNISLHPDNYEVFGPDGGEAATRNFQWKLSGPKPENTGFYGGTVEISTELGSYIGDPENVEFTLTPVGKLIDGSTGTTLTIKCGAPLTETYQQLVGIPIGVYTISAVYLNNGAREPLRIKKKDTQDPLSASTTIEFDPGTLGFNMAYVTFDR